MCTNRPGAAADFEAGASSLAQQAAQCGADAERIGPRRCGTGQELVLIPVRDLVISRRRRRRHPPGLLACPAINAILRTSRQHHSARPDR